MLLTNEMTQLLTPTVEALGYELLGCEFVTEHGEQILRVYLDKEGGIMLDDCERASKQINAVLDVEMHWQDTPYTLEVSSPGVDRPLFTPEQFQRFIGEKVSVSMKAPIDGRRNFKGRLEEVTNEIVNVFIDGQSYALPVGQISKAHLEPEW